MIAAFTVEIANEIPEGAQDWNEYRPFKFLCGSVMCEEHHSASCFLNPYDMIRHLIYLDKASIAFGWKYPYTAPRTHDKYYDIYSWNGLGFGFPVIYDCVPSDKNYVGICQQMASVHCDVMFDFFCRHGYAIGLNSAANAMGFAEDVDWLKQREGELAKWRTGEDREGLFDYSRRKTELLLNVVLKIKAAGGISWFNRRGQRKMEGIDRILTVKEAMNLPEPDVSWLSNPVPRSKFTGWLKGDS